MFKAVPVHFERAKQLTTQRLQQVLKRMVRDLPSGEYIHAQNFLKRVAHEASFSVFDTTGQLAQN